MMSFPKLLVVLSLAIASCMSKVLVCLNLSQEFLLLTTLSPSRRGLGASSIFLARFSPIEQKLSWIYFPFAKLPYQNPLEISVA